MWKWFKIVGSVGAVLVLVGICLFVWASGGESRATRLHFEHEAQYRNVKSAKAVLDQEKIVVAEIDDYLDTYDALLGSTFGGYSNGEKFLKDADALNALIGDQDPLDWAFDYVRSQHIHADEYRSVALNQTVSIESGASKVTGWELRRETEVQIIVEPVEGADDEISLQLKPAKTGAMGHAYYHAAVPSRWQVSVAKWNKTEELPEGTWYLVIENNNSDKSATPPVKVRYQVILNPNGPTADE